MTDNLASPPESFTPEPPRPRPPVRSGGSNGPWIAGALGLVLVALVWVATGLPGVPTDPTPGPSASASGSSGPSAVASASATIDPNPSFVYPTPTPLPTFAAYVVQQGDSLTSVARKFETTPRSVAWWNREAYPSLDPLSEDYNPNVIQPGWTLRVIPGTTFDEGSLPSPTPGPSSTPGPSATATPEPTGPATVVSNGPRGTNQIALTFDMGGRLDPALDIVNWLIDHQVHATIFPTGVAGTTTDQGKAALLLASQHPELFVFGNHSWSHPNFTTLTAAEMAEQLTSTDDAVVSLTGWTTKPWFRPPFGAWKAPVRTAVGEAGWRYMVMWDIDTIDWRPTADGGPTADDIVTKVVSRAQGGSIVLMHLGGFNTFDALPDLISGLQAKGLQPVTLQEMFKP
jgi:peptidoglycan/xylan/chitin deacetylase (PgdA/CDA1 family)